MESPRSADSRAAARRETIQGGGLVCAGIEGVITDEPVDVLIIDDPVRGRAEAESLTAAAHSVVLGRRQGCRAGR